MLDRTQKNDQLATAFAVLSTTITNKCKQSMFDDNRVLETILPTLLNNLYGLSLVDLNVERYNHPAIDLGDYFSGKAVQITADGSKEKMVNTISMLERHGLNDTYKDITFLIISNSQKQSFQRNGYNISIKDLGDIAKDICSLTADRFDVMYHFCETQLRSYFNNNNQSFFQPKYIPSQDPNRSISKFLDRCGFLKPYDNLLEADVRKGLIILKEKLSSLNDDQRWFLYKIMDWAIKYKVDRLWEYCAAPFDYMVSGLKRTNEFSFTTTSKSLESMNLVSYEEEGTWQFDDPHFSIRFYLDTVEDFNFFSGICIFLAANYDRDKLSKIIVHCDFSEID